MICLDDPKKLKIYSNWYEGGYDNPFFMIVECQNSTSDVTCETTENIEDFVRNMEINFFKQRLTFDDSIYEDHAEFTDSKGDYFPVHVVKDRIYNGRLTNYNRTYDGQLYVHNRLGLQQAIYDDSYLQLDFEEKLLETLEIMKTFVL